MSPEAAFDYITATLERIDDAGVQAAYLKFHAEHREAFLDTPASIAMHHAYPGGYSVHLAELAINMRVLAGGIPLPEINYTRDDAITSVYVHDLDKLLYRYERDTEPPTYPQKKKAQDMGIRILSSDTKSTISAKIDAQLNGKQIEEARLSRHKYRKAALAFEDGAIVSALCHEHGLPLSLMALHAVCVHHGGWAPLAQQKNVEIQPLGALLHAADLISSQVQRGDVEPKERPAAPSVTPAKPTDEELARMYKDQSQMRDTPTQPPPVRSPPPNRAGLPFMPPTTP